MDVMRWSTEKAIYPTFLLLSSFKKANSLKADRARERAPPCLQLYIKWIKLIKVACMYFINIPPMGSLEDMHTVPNKFSQEDQRKGERAI